MKRDYREGAVKGVNVTIRMHPDTVAKIDHLLKITVFKSRSDFIDTAVCKLLLEYDNGRTDDVNEHLNNIEHMLKVICQYVAGGKNGA